MVRRLVERDWTGIEYGVYDAIQSYLVEHPDHYYMAPNQQWLCYLTRDHGLLMLVNDFRGLSELEIGDYIVGVLAMLR